MVTLKFVVPVHVVLPSVDVAFIVSRYPLPAGMPLTSAVAWVELVTSMLPVIAVIPLPVTE